MTVDETIDHSQRSQKNLYYNLMCHTDPHQFISEQSKIAEQLGLVKPQVARASLISFSEKKVQRKKLRMLQTEKTQRCTKLTSIRKSEKFR